MKGLPDSKIYELELRYWPYKASWKKVLDYLCQNAPNNGTLLDLMCGPGYLLGKISSKRKDLQLKGLDIDKRYISYSKKQYPQIDFGRGDILSWKPDKLYNVVIWGKVKYLPPNLINV